MRNHTLTSLVAHLPVDTIDNHHPLPYEFGQVDTAQTNYYFQAIRAMLLDDEVASDVELRHATAMTIPFIISGSDADVTFAKQVLDDFDLDDLMEQMLRATEFGFQPIEMFWEKQDGLYVPVNSEPKRPEQFRLKKDGSVFYANYAYQMQSPPMGKIISVVRDQSSERPYGKSVLESLWAIWQSKWISWANIERLGEKYAIPSVAALVPSATSQDELDAVAANLAPIENGSSVALAGVTDVKMLTVSGKVTELLEIITAIDTKISKTITGQTLTSNTQAHGSRALGEVHERAAMRISMKDAKMVFKHLNKTLFKWIFEFNNHPGKIKISVDKEKYQELVDKVASNSSVEKVELSDVKGSEHLCIL